MATLDDYYVGYYLLRMTATALDTTGLDTNTETLTIDIPVVIYQIYTEALEDQLHVITYIEELYEFP